MHLQLSSADTVAAVEQHASGKSNPSFRKINSLPEYHPIRKRFKPQQIV
jgi:hypothetical protein